jgi:ribosomal protein S19E (S16A)
VNLTLCVTTIRTRSVFGHSHAERGNEPESFHFAKGSFRIEFEKRVCRNAAYIFHPTGVGKLRGTYGKKKVQPDRFQHGSRVDRE